MRGQAQTSKAGQRAASALTTDSRDKRDNRHFRVILASVLAPDSTVLDVGANVGDVLREILRVAPAGEHVAFEPLPDLAAKLRRDFPGVDVREVALSDRAGESTFQHVVDAPGYSGLQERDYPEGVHPREIVVRTARLDDELPEVNPTLVKIDVEGAELQVLRGAMQMLARARPVVWFEHGRGGADRYGTRPEEAWDLIDTVGLRVYDADADGPLSRQQFAESFAASRVWNYLAR